MNSNIYNILSNILIEYYNIKYYRYKKILEIKINLMFMLIYLKIMSLDIAFLSLFSEKLANNMKLCDSR